ncbi:MAG: DEAD/DEAH box helicase family protein [Pyrinomonadaceae bacterium]|nr:DEAD/DEAH box helicase family protein [Pyrinomonadaceae bacterium]
MITQTGENLSVTFSAPFDLDKYEIFKRAKRLPESRLTYDEFTDNYRIETHARYANLLGVEPAQTSDLNSLEMPGFLFEHQRKIIGLALSAETFAVWSDCGTGKTLIELEFARQVAHRTGGKVLIFTLKDIIPQMIDEARCFYGDDLKVLHILDRDEMRKWAKSDDKTYLIAVTNYEKMNPDESGQIVYELKNLAGVILDESSRLKSGGGKQKWALIHSCKGIPFKLSCTATPAPNDVIEFASQASFLERMRSENEIIWTFFTKDKVTQEWTVKKHAQNAFFEWMCAWSIYLRDPKKYGWSSSVVLPPDPVILKHQIPITHEQSDAARIFNTNNFGQASLFATQTQGIVGRSKLSQIAKGFVYEKGKVTKRIASNKPKFTADLIIKEAVENQVLVWTVFDEESEIIAELLNKSSFNFGYKFAVLSGKQKDTERAEILEKFRKGEIQILISKAKLLGFGMNFQNVGSMIFSGWDDSFENFYQAVRRAVRYGQTKRVRVHLPYIHELEYAQLENVLRKEVQFVEMIERQEAAYIEAMKRMEIL